MLIPLTRAKFEELIPLIATGPQYWYTAGRWQDFLRRALIAFVGVILLFLFGALLGEGARGLVLLLQVVVGLYWFWSPIYVASVRNSRIRRLAYSGFWRGRVVDVYVTEESLGQLQTLDNRGRLVTVEDLQRCINVIAADREGFEVAILGKLERIHKNIVPGQIAEVLLFSHRSDLDPIVQISDAYFPQLDLWVGEYPYLQRESFRRLSEELRPPGRRGNPSPRRSPRDWR